MSARRASGSPLGQPSHASACERARCRGDRAGDQRMRVTRLVALRSHRRPDNRSARSVCARLLAERLGGGHAFCKCVTDRRGDDRDRLAPTNAEMDLVAGESADQLSVDEHLDSSRWTAADVKSRRHRRDAALTGRQTDLADRRDHDHLGAAAGRRGGIGAVAALDDLPVIRAVTADQHQVRPQATCTGATGVSRENTTRAPVVGEELKIDDPGRLT